MLTGVRLAVSFLVVVIVVRAGSEGQGNARASDTASLTDVLYCIMRYSLFIFR